MWTWLPIFIAASFTASATVASGATPLGTPDPDVASSAALASFAIIAFGALGSVLGGFLSDRFGRTATAMGAMTLSGLSALLTGALFGAAPVLVVAVATIWGLTVVADSSQFSAAISELTPGDRVGSALTLQHALGYLLSSVSIQAVPIIETRTGWLAAFALLALGPAVGVIALHRLRGRAEALHLANGRR